MTESQFNTLGGIFGYAIGIGLVATVVLTIMALTSMSPALGIAAGSVALGTGVLFGIAKVVHRYARVEAEKRL